MTITTVRHVELVVNPFPTAGEPMWDDCAFEWCLADEDGFRYWGNTPDECWRQFLEALHYLAESARKGGFSIEELREFRTEQRDWDDQRENERPY